MMRKIISFLLFISFLFTLNNPQVVNENSQYINTIQTSMALQVNADTLNVRSGPGTNYSIIGQVSYSSIFYAFERAIGSNISGNPYWYHIYWYGKTGWVSGYYLVQPYLPSSDLGFGVEIKNVSLNVYLGPGINYTVIGNVLQGQIYILASHSFYNGTGGDFVQIYYNNQSYGFTGFIPYSGVNGIKLQYFENGYVKRLANYNDAYVSLKKVVFPYIYPVYNGYVSDLKNYSTFISGLHYEEYYLTSSLTLGDWGDGGVGNNATLYDIPKWPMIVNNYNVSRTSSFLSNDQAQNSFINSAVSAGILNHYTGYSIDFEGTSGYTLTDAKNYVIFLNNFADALHSHGMKLAVAPQPAYNGQPNSLLDYYLYNPFTQIRVDYVMPQCYEGYFSSYYPYDFIGAVQSIINAVGPYLSINQIVILLMTTNPNTNSYFSMQEMNERIYYIEKMGINGIGIWSMNQQGGFPQSQYLWQQLADFEYKDSECFNYQEDFQPGSFSLFSYADGNGLGYQLIGFSGQNVPTNGSILQVYKSYSPIKSVIFNASIYLPTNFSFYTIGKDNSGKILKSYAINKSGQYFLNFTGAYEIDFTLYTSTNNYVTLYFNNPTIVYISNISFSYDNTYTNYDSIIGMTCDNNYPSYVRYAVLENYGWTPIHGKINYKITSNTNIINIYFTLENNQSFNAINVSLFAISSTGTILAKYYFINNIKSFSYMNYSYDFPKGTNFIEFQVSSSFNILNSIWQIILNNIKINVGLNYNVTFLEKGLPAYTKWYVNLSNGQSFSSTTNTITFSEPNGTYSYTISTVNNNYAPSPSSGTFTVNGANVNVAITFTLVTYTIKFTESGLPLGTKWSVTLSGITKTSNTTTIIFNEPNGSYTFSVGIVSGYTASPSSGTIIINGNNVDQGITFTVNGTKVYTVTFTENGLPSGTKWYVNLINGKSYSGTGTTITFNEPNGTYSYTIATVNKDYSPSPSSGTFTVNGANVNVEIKFTLVIYKITFTESGLPLGTMWYVNLSNGQSFSSTVNTIIFNEPNGTYSYTISTVNKDYSPSPSSGTFTVNGANVNIGITFNLVTYRITFTENGLPSGTSWSVILNNIIKTSTNATITFYEPNGTYTYSIKGISGYRANTYSGTINVNGNPVSNSITWTVITYPITITENGIPNGTSWSATLTGTTFNGQSINDTLSSDTNTITFNEPNGTYTYTIHLPSGYQGSNTKGSINVFGNSATLTIKAWGTMNYLWIVTIAAVIIIAVAIGIILLRKGKNKNDLIEQKEPPKQN